MGMHDVKGPCHCPNTAAHPSGLVKEQIDVGGAPGLNVSRQHAPRHGYGLHVAMFGMKYAVDGHWLGEATAMHCPLG